MDIKSEIAKAGVPAEYTDQVVACLATSKRLFQKVTPYKLSAMFVMAILVWFMKWEDNKMTDMLKRNPFKFIQKFWPGVEDFLDNYDNNISINGDGLEWVVDPVNGVDYDGILYGRKPMPLEDTPEVRAKCYWMKGHHPRSRLARYVWLGLRNRASKIALKLGPVVPRDSTYIQWRIATDDENHVTVNKMGDYWQVTTSKRYWKIVRRYNLGYKINNFKGDLTKNLMVTYKTIDFVKSKIV